MSRSFFALAGSMRWAAALGVLGITIGSAPAFADDVNNAYAIATAAKASGIALDYSISGWNSFIDLNISSMLPGDARTIAEAVCTFARQKQTWTQPWTVRVFLVVGDRPAAQCSTR